MNKLQFFGLSFLLLTIKAFGMEVPGGPDAKRQKKIDDGDNFISSEPSVEEKEDLPAGYIPVLTRNKISAFTKIINCPCGRLLGFKGGNWYELEFIDHKIFMHFQERECHCHKINLSESNLWIMDKKSHKDGTHLVINHCEGKKNSIILYSYPSKEHGDVSKIELLYKGFGPLVPTGTLNITDKEIKFAWHDMNGKLPNTIFLHTISKSSNIHATKIIDKYSPEQDLTTLKTIFYNGYLYYVMNSENIVLIINENGDEIKIENHYSLSPSSAHLFGKKLYIYLLGEFKHGIIIFDFETKQVTQKLLAFSMEGMDAGNAGESYSEETGPVSEKRYFYLGSRCCSDYLMDFAGTEGLLFIRYLKQWHFLTE